MKKSILFLMMLLAATTVSAQDLVDRVSQAVGVELPSEYKQKVKDFVATNIVMKDEDGAQFTEQFILEEMKKDWKINRQDQLLFIWHSIYHQITESNLYDGGDSDSNGKRMEEFNSKAVSIRIRTCGSKYSLSCIKYMRQLSAEARRQSAEARQRSINALNKALESVISFYNSYTISPDPERLASFKPKVKELISRCKDLNINYKEKLSPEILKFFDIE